MKLQENKIFTPNNIPLIQPMDQKVISNFKELYNKAMFQRCFQVTNETELTLREFWKDHYNIFQCLKIIEKALMEVFLRTMYSAWKYFWLECVAAKHFEGFDELPIVPDIVVWARLWVWMTPKNVNVLVDDHKTQLTTEELQHLNQQQQK